MDPILSLMRDLEQSISQASTESREATVARVTDLLVGNAERAAAFDPVIAALAVELEVTRRELQALIAVRAEVFLLLAGPHPAP